MSTYTDIQTGVFEFTNRPDLVAETDSAIRSAIRTAHTSGSYWRDLVSIPLTGLDTTQAIQTIDLSASAPNFKQLASIGVTGSSKFYDVVDIRDLLDDYKQFKTDVCYGLGTNLIIRPAAPSDTLTLTYWKHPTVLPMASIDSWIAQQFPDLIICWAAATVFSLIGEDAIKARVEGLAKLAFQTLTNENLSIQRR